MERMNSQKRLIARVLKQDPNKYKVKKKKKRTLPIFLEKD